MNIYRKIYLIYDICIYYLYIIYHVSIFYHLSTNHLSTTLSSIYLTSIHESRDGKNAEVHIDFVTLLHDPQKTLYSKSCDVLQWLIFTVS